METRKFIWNFFIVIVTLLACVIQLDKAQQEGGFWRWVMFVILALVAVSAGERVEETFKPKK